MECTFTCSPSDLACAKVFFDTFGFVVILDFITPSLLDDLRMDSCAAVELLDSVGSGSSGSNGNQEPGTTPT